MELFLLVWAASVLGSAFLAKSKGRNPWAWAWLGLFLNVIGLAIAALVPSRHGKTSKIPVDRGASKGWGRGRKVALAGAVLLLVIVLNQAGSDDSSDTASLRPQSRAAERRSSVSQDVSTTSGASASRRAQQGQGLSGTTRRSIFWELASMEDDSWRQAMSRYPLEGPGSSTSPEQVNRQLDLQQQIYTEGLRLIARKYGVSGEDIDNIIIEGVQAGWPTP